MNIFAEITQPLPVPHRPLWPIYLGWLCYVVSMFLPAVGDVEGGRFESNLDGWVCAWFSLWFCWLVPPCLFYTAANVIMIASPFFTARVLSGNNIRMEFYCVLGASLIALSVLFFQDALRLGYYLWLASFLSVAVGLYILIRGSSHSGHTGET